MKTAFIIGRFQPFHAGHAHIIRQAIADGMERIVFLVGSANRAVSIKNPFTFVQRCCQIDRQMNKEFPNFKNFNYCAVNDYSYNDTMWINQVYRIISEYAGVPNASIYGYLKDSSSEYLRWFPGVKLVNVEPLNYGISILNATEIREKLYTRILELEHVDFPDAQKELADISATFQIADVNQLIYLAHEFKFVQEYRKEFAGMKYPPTFVTTDAVVIQSGHILLVKRKENPGKGLWALPGGFLNANKDRYLVDCAIRELYEETNIKVPEKVLRASIVETKAFDEVGRSTRGRTITHAFYIKLDDTCELPKVRAADDAEKAQWVPLSAVNPCELYEDHWDIITHFMNK